METRPNPLLQHQARRVQVGRSCLHPATRLEFVEGVVVGDRGQHASLPHAQFANQRHILGRGANPGGRLDRRSMAIAFQCAFQRGAIGRPVDEELRLPNRARLPGELAHEIVNAQALLGRQRQTALLTVAMRGLGRPNLSRQPHRTLDPVIPREVLAGKTFETVVWFARVGNGGHRRLLQDSDSFH